MKLPAHVSHYFEKEYGPLLNICDLDPEQRSQIIHRERNAETGFNRFSFGDEFFNFRVLADDLLLNLYEQKYGVRPERRPFYGVLGDADVVGGLYRNPQKLQIPIEDFDSGELTFMCPDHFHLVSLMNKGFNKKMFGLQLPEDYSESKYPYFGKLLTYEELLENFYELKINQHLDRERKEYGWYRYVEAQIWSEPEALRKTHGVLQALTPEPWTHTRAKITFLQNHNQIL